MNKKLLFLAGLAPLVAAPALVVASCSSSTTTDGTTGMTPEETAAATKAIENAKNYLESKSYFFADKKPTEVDLKQIALPALKPSQNLGFSTKYFYDDKNVTNNDETGEKTIRIEVSRGKAKLSNQSAVLKLKSTKDDESDDKTNVDKLLNLDPTYKASSLNKNDATSKTTVRKATVFVKDYDQATAPEASKITDFVKDFKTEREKLFLKEKSDEKVTKLGIDLGFKSLVKATTTKAGADLTIDNFLFENVRQTKVGSIEAPSITFDLRLQSDDKSKKSAPVEVNLVGFRLDEGYKVKDLFNQAITEFGGLYNPIIDESKTANVKASSVTKDNLTNYLLTDWKDMGGDLIVPIEIESSIVDVVSSNDSEGSLTVKFKFKRVGQGADKTPIEDEKEIKLFGFQLVQQ